MASSPSDIRRWLLLLDFCAMVLAILGSEEMGLTKGFISRPALLLGAGIYLVVTAVIIYLLFRRAAAPSPTPTHSILGRPGPSFLASFPRFLMGFALLGYALWLRQ